MESYVEEPLWFADMPCPIDQFIEFMERAKQEYSSSGLVDIQVWVKMNPDTDTPALYIMGIDNGK